MFDVVVVGAGPAGSVAALVLARGGADVALVDRASFPRDKACGDLVGPRGTKLLQDLGLTPPAARQVGDIELVGPSRRTVRLRWPAGRKYAPWPVAVRRREFDAGLRNAALEAGAEPLTGAVRDLADGSVGVRGVVLADGRRIAARFIIGADGALSRVAAAAGLLRAEDALWGFALRAYVAADVGRPRIVFWAPDGRGTVPGYGWVFPGGSRQANVGVGVGLRDRRHGGRLAPALLPDFVRLACGDRVHRLEDRRGGWLRFGLAGIVPARGDVLLAGDAAGLVNPLQGEGIAEALASGRTAAEAVLAEPGRAAAAYRHAIDARYGRYYAAAAAVHAALVSRPRAITGTVGLLTTPVIGRALAPGWWLVANDLLDDSTGGPARAVGVSLAAAGILTTACSPRRRAIRAALTG